MGSEMCIRDRCARANALCNRADAPAAVEPDAKRAKAGDAVAPAARHFAHEAGATVVQLALDGARAQIEVTYATGGAERVARVDTLVALVGYRPDLQLARELHAHLCYASEGPMKLAASLLKASASAGGTSGGDCMSQAAPGAGTLLTPEPRFFVLGAKSYARNPAFLLRVGFEQARLVAELLRADADARSHEGPAAVVAGAQ